MKYITAFFMAWGNFITLPCPYKKWDSKLLNMMLMFLPAIGAVIGALWVIVIELMLWFGVPDQVTAFAAVFFLFAICGFMHLDGFMDCNDAILSRRPLEERQRILKDSNVGAFAVVSVVFLLLGWYAAMTVQIQSTHLLVYFLIPIVSRLNAGWDVLAKDPIGHSQYAADHEEKGKWKYQLVMIIEAMVFLIIWVLIFGIDTISMADPIIICVEGTACICASAFAQKQLGGMSGDIAGYTICFGELAAIITAAIVL
ncbi:adenosylcobinamide-GDP ribazoletransferase [Aminicella lysinilytica]|uniref:Adenosylcobinamide-GDP ribazoletransferase n=1 Tax=Aminicella lysinilytica TaxID=433323 RepID=A0A4R6PYJ8_9FIRM|nr:adenosylcobinamide-GDP ribazoletransferase [Aminicella lysinilytica]TDP51384.1 cobalamin-5'-phosphate synthase [Aminicella lysinilytica]